MKSTMNISFEIVGAKYEYDGELNYKYIDNANDFDEALSKFDSTEGYPYRYLRLVVEDDGAQLTFTIAGDKAEHEWEPLSMRMEMANLWCQTMEQQFVDVAMSWEQQIEEIVDEVKRLRAELRLCQSQSDHFMQRIRELEAMPAHTPWQVVHLGFLRGELGWTQSFDALMSQCGMPMEEALMCLVEHFDRRPAIQETEVTE